MKAVYYEGKETIGVRRSVPVAPSRGQVQIRVSHCGICGTDLHLFHGEMDHRVPRAPGNRTRDVRHDRGRRRRGGRFCAGRPRYREAARPLRILSRLRRRPQPYLPAFKIHRDRRAGCSSGVVDGSGSHLHRLPAALTLEQGALVEPIAVACHDVRMGEVTADDFVVVQGGGPIGLLIALVARSAGARVLISEINPFRLRLASGLGLTAVDPMQTDLVEQVNEATGGAGADVVFEGSGSTAGAGLMTRLPRTRGRIVVVAMFAELPQVDLFRFFWRELRMTGARGL